MTIRLTSVGLAHARPNWFSSDYLSTTQHENDRLICASMRINGNTIQKVCWKYEIVTKHSCMQCSGRVYKSPGYVQITIV